MNVSLTPELDNFIAEKVASGFYSSASEVIRESLRLLKEQDDLRLHRMKTSEQISRKGLTKATEARCSASPLRRR
ncbi:MAG: type II toxin-antitoxin system ParD family antitoxin [Acidobacteriota bacterium]